MQKSSEEYATPVATVDVVLLTVRGGTLSVLLIRRANEPWAGQYALPGGFVHVDEDQDLDDAVRRVLRTKVGVQPAYLEQLRTFGSRSRDERGWSLSVSYMALVPEGAIVPQEGVDYKIVPIDSIRSLPFDHAEIVRSAAERVRSKSSYSSLPCYLLGEEFTLRELEEIYEQVLATELDTSSFRRKVFDQGIVEVIDGRMRSGGSHRPSQLYRMAGDLRAFNRTL